MRLQIWEESTAKMEGLVSKGTEVLCKKEIWKFGFTVESDQYGHQEDMAWWL